MWIVRVLPLGVLDGTAWFSSLSGYLVSNGRQVPPKACKIGRFRHRSGPVGQRARGRPG
jgi:hypothetical protein